MIRETPRSTRKYTLLTSTTLFRAGGGRADLDQQVGQAVDAHLRGGRGADHREHGGRLDAERERVLELAQRRDVALEVALQQRVVGHDDALHEVVVRSEEHTSELQSLMRISYAVFCLKKKNKT